MLNSGIIIRSSIAPESLTVAAIRAYETLEDSVSGYADFLASNPRYKPMLEAKTTDEQISALGESGYATDSKYGDKIRSIVRGLST